MSQLADVTSVITPTTATAAGSHEKTVLLFWAPWHEVSAGRLQQVLLALSDTFSPSIHFGRVEAEAYPEVAAHYGVTVVPTVLLLETFDTSSNVVAKLEGEEVAPITQAIQRWHASASTATSATSLPQTTDASHITTNNATKEGTTATTLSIEDRLKRLIRSNHVMLFIKGTPEAPKCGFSRQAVQILDEEGIAFGSFDILNDDDVRQGLKEYSDWPTYPQLYVNGELIGGLDIMKELQQEGDLKEQLGITNVQGHAKEQSLEDRLKQLVNRHKVMLFMKGLPSAPKCGFSRQICELLESHHVSYDAFNILEDNEVREGLKKFSDWPTYPQLYVNGDLVGGLDICKEMVDSGDLQDLLDES